MPIEMASEVIFELELIFKSEGWHKGTSSGRGVGKFNGSPVGMGVLEERLQAVVSTTVSNINTKRFIIGRVYH